MYPLPDPICLLVLCGHANIYCPTRLAYCEIYVTLGMLFRRFEHMKSNDLTAEDLVYDDYFSSYHPIPATKFHVTAGQGD
jgi:hypothetical protein